MINTIKNRPGTAGDTENKVHPVQTVRMPTRHGLFTATIWTCDEPGPGSTEIITISSLDDRPVGRHHAGADSPAPVVRIHSECLTGEALGSVRCDCGPQLDAALQTIGQTPGVVVYLRQEGRGIGLVEKFRAYALQDEGLDTVDANIALGHRPDERSYTAATAILRRLGLTKIRLMTNNPDKLEAVLYAGIEAERVPANVGRHPENEDYLATKAERMGHILPITTPKTDRLARRTG
jgi:3,4-dihydroxy 2-butanone 4-phosphate synthase / GTP cyclohydrolase II